MCYNSMQHVNIYHLLLAVSQAFPVPRGPSVRGLKCFIKLIKSQQQSHTYNTPGHGKNVFQTLKLVVFLHQAYRTISDELCCIESYIKVKFKVKFN